MLALRLATLADVPAIENLIASSVRTLQAHHYTSSQREAALGTVFGVDRSLIDDGTYYVIEAAGSELAAAGGWSRRATLFGSDSSPVKEDRWLHPARDAARIRAFFVSPPYARRGLGTRLLEACEAAARAAGFTRLELMATLTGVPLYSRHGFLPIEEAAAPLANGETLPLVRMAKQMA